MSERDAETIPAVLLERYVLGELPPDQRAALEARHGQALREAAAALREDNGAQLASMPPETVAHAVRGLLPEPSPKRRPVMAWAATCAAAAAALLLWVRAPGTPEAPRSPGSEAGSITPERTRIKGLEPHLVLYRDSVAGGERLRAGARVAEGDVVQVAYVAAGAGFGVIASVDGRGEVTVHFPDPGSDGRLTDAGETALSFAYELDDAPTFERFVMVTGDAPLDITAVRVALDGLGPDDEFSWPQGHTASFLLRK